MTRDEFAEAIRESFEAVRTMPNARFWPEPGIDEIEALIDGLWQDYQDDIAIKGGDHAGD